jgi:hypothetical protein
LNKLLKFKKLGVMALLCAHREKIQAITSTLISTLAQRVLSIGTSLLFFKENNQFFFTLRQKNGTLLVLCSYFADPQV